MTGTDPLHKYPPAARYSQPAGPSTASASATTADNDGEEKPPMQDEAYWAWGTAGWFALLSLPLLLFPRFILFLATPSADLVARDTLTPLERFLSVHVGLLLFGLAVALILAIPSPPLIDQPIPNRPHTPQTHPLLYPLTPMLLLSSFLAYNTPSSSLGPLGLLLASGNGAVGVWGAWVCVFGGGGHFSKRMGKNKRTGWFVGERGSAGVIRKAWRRERERERGEGEGIELKKL